MKVFSPNIQLKNVTFRSLASWQTLLLLFAIFSTVFIGRHYINVFFQKQAKTQLFNFLDYAKKSLSESSVLPIEICSNFETGRSYRITLIGSSGRVVCDSEKDPAFMEDHRFRPEIIEALKSGRGSSVRESSTLNYPMIYGAIRLVKGDEVFVLRKSIPLSLLNQTLRSLDRSIYLLLIPLTVFLAVVSLWGVFAFEGRQGQVIKKMKEDLVSNISHEMRTPLTSIKGYLQLALRSRGEMPQELAFHLNRVQKNVDRLSDLFSDILSLSSIEKSEERTLEPVAVDNLIDDLVTDIGEKYNAKDIAVTKNIESVDIDSDPTLLQHILGNLIDNAFKYTKKGNRISIAYFKTGARYTFEIEDAGIGIPEKDLPHIFKRFFRVDSSRSRELGGTGLGLAIVKHAVEKLNGKIKVTSQENVGTKFVVTL